MKKILLFILMMGLISSVALADALPVDISLAFLGVEPSPPLYGMWPAGYHIVLIGGSPLEEYNGIYNGFCIDPAMAQSSFSPYTLRYVPEIYYEAAWVFENFETLGGSPRDAQIVIWNLYFTFMPGLEGGPLGIQQELFDGAEAALLGGYTPPDSILIASSPRGVDGETFDAGYQDFMIRVVPEPGSIILLGLGLLSVATVARFKKK
jgi:hypothetical protein